MSEELMSLEEIDLLCVAIRGGPSLHSLKAKLDQSAAALSWVGSAINGTHPELAKSDLRRTPTYEDALALRAENEKLRSDCKYVAEALNAETEENRKLHSVKSQKLKNPNFRTYCHLIDNQALKYCNASYEHYRKLTRAG